MLTGDDDTAALATSSAVVPVSVLVAILVSDSIAVGRAISATVVVGVIVVIVSVVSIFSCDRISASVSMLALFAISVSVCESCSKTSEFDAVEGILAKSIIGSVVVLVDGVAVVVLTVVVDDNDISDVNTDNDGCSGGGAGNFSGIQFCWGVTATIGAGFKGGGADKSA